MNNKIRIYIVLALLNSIFIQAQISIGVGIDGEMAQDNSGRSISLSADGNVVAIGTAFNEGSGVLSGHVRIYENVSGSWVQIGDDINGEAAGDQSGASLSISADGNIVAIGAPQNDGNGSNSGHVRIYENVSGNWVQLGEDINGEAIDDQSGFSVSLSADGSTVVIGAIVNDGNGVSSGHVRIYQLNLTANPINWQQLGEDIDSEALQDFSGRSVSLNVNGSIVAVGAALNDGNGSNSGHVRVYKLNETVNPVVWEQLGQDIDGEAQDDFSGWSVSLSADGSIIAIGSRSNDGNGDSSGHVRVYKLNETGNPVIWEQLGQDIDGEAAEDESGISLSLSADGNFVAIGAPKNDGNGSNSGHTKIYKNVSDNWVQFGEDINGESSFHEFGTSVSLSADGSVVAIGEPRNNNNGTNAGQVRIYDLSQITLNSNKVVLNELRLYPNPSKNTITISGVKQPEDYSVYNVMGKHIAKGKISNNNQIAIEKFSDGLYFLKLENGHTIKFIKN